jgi:hypothetical protein
MPREKQDYIINLENLRDKFGDRETLTVAEVCSYLSCDRRTVLKTEGFPRLQLGGKYYIPATGFARWLSTYRR